MSRLDRAARAARQRLRRRRPLVSVIVAVRGSSPFLGDCITSVLGSTRVSLEVLLASATSDREAQKSLDSLEGLDPRVRRLASAEESYLDDAIGSATGRFLCFADSDDVVPAQAYVQLAGSLEDSQSDFAVGSLHRQVGSRFHDPDWSNELFYRSRCGLDLSDCPEALVDLSLQNKMFRRSFWSSAGLSIGSSRAHQEIVTATRAYLRSRAFDLVAHRVYEQRARDATSPLRHVRRYSAEDVRDRLDALLDSLSLVRDSGPAELVQTWFVQFAEFLLPPLYADAVGGREPYFHVLSSKLQDLLPDAPARLMDLLTVNSRICLWLATNGSLTDLALMLDFIGDSPGGLPLGEDGLVRLPDALTATPPDDLCRPQDVDRRVRSRLQRVVEVDEHGLRLDGAAFVEYVPENLLPEVELAGDRGTQLHLRVERRTDPTINLWSGRCWEDRSGAGFSAFVPPSALAGHPDTIWHVSLMMPGFLQAQVFQARTRPDIPDRVVLELGRGNVELTWGSRGLQVQAVSQSGQPSGMPTGRHETIVEHAEIVNGRLRLTGRRSTNAPARWWLTGPRGSTEPACPTAELDGFSIDLELSVVQWGERTPLPADRYTLMTQEPSGDRGVVGWADQVLASTAPDLLTPQLRISFVAGKGGAVDVVVSPPLSVEERGPFHQKRLISSVYASAGRPSYDRTVLFESFRGRSVGDSPGAICRELLARNQDLDLVWVVDDPSVTAPAGTRAVARRSRGWFDVLSGARGYVSNAGAPKFYEKKRGQFHLQTWHGTPLKKLAEDRGPGDLATWRHNRLIASQSSRWDGMISPSPYCTEIFRSAFQFSGKMLETGYPRNDILVGDRAASVRDEVRSRLGLGVDDRAVLYAPTWREYFGVRDAKPLYLDAKKLTSSVAGSLVLVRGHYNSTHQADVFTDHQRILDVTRYPDIADLYLAADILVTDYSSVMFDFALTDKPIILLTPDLEQYRDVERGFYFDIEHEGPGPLLDNTEEVAAALNTADAFAEQRAAFRRRFCPWDDGGASARVVDDLLQRW